MKMSIRIWLIAFGLAALLVGCAEVGSERWCENMKAKPKGDWSTNEAADYARHCLLR